MRNGRVARDLALLHPPSRCFGVTRGARRESAMRDSAKRRSGNLTGRAWEAHILYGPRDCGADEQRSSSGKDRQPRGLFSGWRLAALLLSHRALAMLLRRALPAASQKTARPFLILIGALILALLASGCVHTYPPEIAGQRLNAQGEVIQKILRVNRGVTHSVLGPDGPRDYTRYTCRYYLQEEGKPKTGIFYRQHAERPFYGPVSGRQQQPVMGDAR